MIHLHHIRKGRTQFLCLADTSVRSARELFIFIMKITFIGSKYRLKKKNPKKKLLNICHAAQVWHSTNKELERLAPRVGHVHKLKQQQKQLLMPCGGDINQTPHTLKSTNRSVFGESEVWCAVRKPTNWPGNTDKSHKGVQPVNLHYYASYVSFRRSRVLI